ncbi:hypothetical protein [Oceanobacillus sp. CAU 1775]
MKPFEREDELDRKLKSINNKFRMTGKEQQSILANINGQMDSQPSTRHKKSTRWKYYFTSTAAIFIILILALPFMNNTFENQMGSSEFSGKLFEVFSSSVYKGPSLNVGVIGEEPDVREKNVHFHTITFNDLKEDGPGFDAIIIMKDLLKEAADDKYIEVYQDLKIPIFFVESQKSYVPFITEGLTYDKVPDMNIHVYFTGILFRTKDDFQVWEFELYNNVKSSINILKTYSSLFETIESLR